METLIAATVLAATAVAIMAPVYASYKQTESMQQSSIAASLVRQLLDEITAKPFLDPQDGVVSQGPGIGETSPAAFDDIGDYDGYTDTTAPLTQVDGAKATWAGAAGYRRTVKVEFRTTPNGLAVASGDFAMITVTVAAADGQQVTVQRLVSNYPRLLLKSTP